MTNSHIGSEYKPCPECGAPMVYEERDDASIGHGPGFRTLAWWCTVCGEGVFDGPALQARQKAAR